MRLLSMSHLVHSPQLCPGMSLNLHSVCVFVRVCMCRCESFPLGSVPASSIKAYGAGLTLAEPWQRFTGWFGDSSSISW